MSKVIKGIKLRLYPNQSQREQLWQMFGNDRFVWNQMLGSFLVVNHNLAQAFKMLFRHRGGYPHFKNRHSLRQSYTGRSTCKVLARRRMQLPKLGSIRTSRTGLVGDAKIKRYTVSYEPTGRYYLSLQVETEVNQLPEMHQSVGLDMGLADLAISSDGVKYGTFNAEWLEKQAVRWQRK
ncbi:helix-turn-helix domain-containing protein, partial [Ligilactobacillus ruminis]|uniref:helix-turn-helix domain-containing protein n=1 Tax=Ligilactobacillus ruminis TaxID=1623 RepID=UPI001C02BE51|nr:helix-turn-helix domain-containing protein [Ligilactobacillus ruminis]